MTPLRILWHHPYPHGVGADRWIIEAWRQGFRALGHEFHVLTNEHEPAKRLREINPNIFISLINVLDITDRRICEMLRESRRRGTRVLVWTSWPLSPNLGGGARAEAIKREDGIVDLYFGENEMSQMARFIAETGRPYQVVPNAANPTQHYPGDRNEKYAYDVVYLGTNLRKKRWFAENVVPEVRRRWRFGVFGPGWTMRDNLLRGAAKAFKVLKRPGVAAKIDNLRITVPEEEERQLYFTAKICLNFHEREDDGSQPHCVVNQRTFKIAACGGFQICDDVPEVRQYFTEDELVIAPLKVSGWLDRIEYYLAHDDVRKEIARNAAARTSRDHMSTNRARQLLDLTGFATPAEKMKVAAPATSNS